MKLPKRQNFCLKHSKKSIPRTISFHGRAAALRGLAKKCLAKLVTQMRLMCFMGAFTSRGERNPIAINRASSRANNLFQHPHTFIVRILHLNQKLRAIAIRNRWRRSGTNFYYFSIFLQPPCTCSGISREHQFETRWRPTRGPSSQVYYPVKYLDPHIFEWFAFNSAPLEWTIVRFHFLDFTPTRRLFTATFSSAQSRHFYRPLTHLATLAHRRPNTRPSFTVGLILFSFLRLNYSRPTKFFHFIVNWLWRHQS